MSENPLVRIDARSGLFYPFFLGVTSAFALGSGLVLLFEWAAVSAHLSAQAQASLLFLLTITTLLGGRLVMKEVAFVHAWKAQHVIVTVSLDPAIAEIWLRNIGPTKSPSVWLKDAMLAREDLASTEDRMQTAASEARSALNHAYNRLEDLQDTWTWFVGLVIDLRTFVEASKIVSRSKTVAAIEVCLDQMLEAINEQRKTVLSAEPIVPRWEDIATRLGQNRARDEELCGFLTQCNCQRTSGKNRPVPRIAFPDLNTGEVIYRCPYCQDELTVHGEPDCPVAQHVSSTVPERA